MVYVVCVFDDDSSKKNRQGARGLEPTHVSSSTLSISGLKLLSLSISGLKLLLYGALSYSYEFL
jgi:hypothetical protein